MRDVTAHARIVRDSDSSGNSPSIKKFITQQILNGINLNLVSNYILLGSNYIQNIE